MKLKTLIPTIESTGEIPTIEGERHFLAQCEYIMRSRAPVGDLVRRLLRQRGWSSRWSAGHKDEVWSKLFPDGTTQHLPEDDAFYFEQEHCREYFRQSGIAMRPRNRHPLPPCLAS